MEKKDLYFEEDESVDEEGFRSGFRHVSNRPAGGFPTRRYVVLGILVLISLSFFGGVGYLVKGSASDKPGPVVSMQKPVGSIASGQSVDLQAQVDRSSRIREYPSKNLPPESPAAAQPAEKKEGKAVLESNRDGFAVQVAAFREKGRTERLLAEIRKAGYEAYVSVTQNGRWRRVRIGNYGSRSDAMAVKNQLLRRGYRPLVVKEG